MQKYVRGWLLKCAYVKLQTAAITLQANIRGFARRDKFLYMRRDRAATRIQVNVLVRVAQLRGLPSVLFLRTRRKTQSNLTWLLIAYVRQKESLYLLMMDIVSELYFCE